MVEPARILNVFVDLIAANTGGTWLALLGVHATRSCLNDATIFQTDLSTFARAAGPL